MRPTAREALVSSPTAERGHAPVQGNSDPRMHPAAIQLGHDCDVEQPNRASAECWSPEEIDADAVSHADTLRPSAAPSEVLR